MNAGLTFLEQIRALPGGGWIAETFNSLVASILASYHAEHTVDDHHGNIKCLSLSVWNQMTRQYDPVTLTTTASLRFAALTHTKAGSTDTNNVTSAAIDTTGADLIVLSLGFFTSAPPTISDSNGNTWTALTASVNGTITNRVYYAIGPIVGGGHTFTATSVGGFPGIAVSAFRGCRLASPLDQQSTGTAAASTTVTAGAITPTLDYELVVASVAVAADGVSASGLDSGFVLTDSQAKVAGQCVGVALAYYIAGAIAPQNPTWTVSGNSNLAASIAALRPRTA